MDLMNMKRFVGKRRSFVGAIDVLEFVQSDTFALTF
jgi:hypothetical protein